MDFLTFANDSPDSGSASSSSGGLSPAFAIDPQLMATPATSKAPSDFGDDDVVKDEQGLDEDEDEDEEGPVTPPPVRHPNKGKDRRPVVHSGGIQKKVHISSVVKTDSLDNTMDDWRPTADEYQKLTSREKRQLRNKISARNFRNRRKEYINALEGDVAERDRLIDAIRTELGSTKSENAALQQEIKTLKKALLGSVGHSSSPVLPPPTPLPISPVPALRSSTSTPSLLTPNIHKDLPSTSPRLAAKAFWGGSSSTFGGVTPVHTVTIPDLLAGAAIKSPALQENINPSLNTNNGINSVGLATLGAAGKPAPFDAFADSNPFTMKVLDAYRMQLWSRMAQQQQQHQATSVQQQPAAPSPPSLTGLAAGLRPHYFSSAAAMRSSPSSPALSSLLSGKHHPIPSSFASIYPTPPSSPKLGSTSTSTSSTLSPTPQQAALASMASQTLMQRLGNAFWQAFSGSTTASTLPHTVPVAGTSTIPQVPAWDADKIRRVLEGTAVVRVVDVELPSSVQAVGKAGKNGTEAAKEAKEIVQQSQPQPACAKICASARETGLCVLEESMRALTLGKK
ncbi:hypothetical protein BJV77DRAFT_965125 [Russula vinacea]|nr:hypothetical protein BJV77DRAFT_965125 [Russula vinacea]